MSVFGRLLGKKDKIEIDAEGMSDEEKLLLMNWMKDRKAKSKLVEVDE